jgi:predicted transcriptional regulator
MSASGPGRQDDQVARSPATGEPIKVILTDAQIEEILRGIAGSQGSALREFLLSRLEHANARAEWSTDDPQTSQSLLRALKILRHLSLADREQGLYSIAQNVGGTPSTTRRYLATLTQVGLVAQSEETLKYELVTTPEPTARGKPTTDGEHTIIALSKNQIEEALRGVAESHGSTLHGFLLARAGRLKQLGAGTPYSPEISRSLLRALLILRFLMESSAQEAPDIATGVGLGYYATRRYLSTLTKVGLVEQIESPLKYRLATGE